MGPTTGILEGAPVAGPDVEGCPVVSSVDGAVVGLIDGLSVIPTAG